MLTILAIHPTWKLEYARVKWDDTAFKEGVEALEKAVRISEPNLGHISALGLTTNILVRQLCKRLSS